MNEITEKLNRTLDLLNGCLSLAFVGGLIYVVKMIINLF